MARGVVELNAELRAIVAGRAFGRCEICAEPGSEFSHRVARGMGGRGSAEAVAASDAASNALWACRTCHRLIESGPALAYERGYKVRRGYDPATVPAWLVSPLGGRAWVLLTDTGLYVPTSENSDLPG